MTNFDHVEDKSFHAMLNGDISQEMQEAALDAATDAIGQDYASEIIPTEVINLRAAALDAAELYSLRHYAPGVLANLKIFWAV